MSIMVEPGPGGGYISEELAQGLAECGVVCRRIGGHQGVIKCLLPEGPVVVRNVGGWQGQL